MLQKITTVKEEVENIEKNSEQKDKINRYMIDEKELFDKIDKLNKKADEEKLDISFEYNKEINRTYISVVDKISGKVIEKLPSESAMKFCESMNELVGMILNKKG
jgi:uncharacterized FlaG/YvyC family protein